ncbi:MAG: OB-fold domain-containing protein [Deltaproteobacteria bacterium]|nr:OB-fold domain-containing protein [Deltaproteobacteria bacterium]
MAGIVRYGSYVPYFRLTRAALGAGKGERAVASFDEDAVSLAVEAARDAVRGLAAVDALLFATLSPAYAEKLDTATIQAALDLPEAASSVALGGSSRMGLAALLLGLDLAAAGKRALVCASDLVTGAPGGARESQGGDAAAAFVTGPDSEAVARVLGCASATIEILDAWRLPEDRFARQWEERFTADTMGPAIIDTARRALQAGGVDPATLSTVILDGTNPRSMAALPKALGLKPEQLADTLAASVGRAGCAHAGLLLARALDAAKPGDRILVVCEADGADAVVLEVTGAIADLSVRKVDRWIASKRNDLAYNTYLKWRGILPFEPPRRPDPERPAAPPMRRHERWKLAFVGSRCTKCRTGHLPPQRVCVKCGAVDQMHDERFADTSCRIATYTLDHLAYTLQPPVVAAFVDYEGGGRFACELTDVDPKQVAIGNHLEMTFRRLFTAQGVHNYFWKARPGR